MPTESALVFDDKGSRISWHLPEGRSGGYIPDTRSLWDLLWEHREHLGGVAHTHPWNGEAHPSPTDTSTFAAIEAGLGRRLLWPVVTMTEVRYFGYNTITGEYVEVAPIFAGDQGWQDNIEELRKQSNGG